MSCPDGQHDLRAVNPFEHPTKNVEVIGAPPQTREEPAWCRICGALWSKRPFGLGWGFNHPAIDRDAPTIANIARKAFEQRPVKTDEDPS